ncbi:MAG: DUF5343 domain-containing protein [Proteobacteria bacterium]|nr:DUF5343 domain-containing protein [Pseudomonadota bacterium]
MATKPEKPVLPPYISYKTFTNFISGLRETGVPHQIDKSVLRTMAGAVQSATIASLKFLGLIDSSAIPTKKLKQLVETDGDNYTVALKDVLVESYSFLLGNGINIEQATGTQVENKFKEQGVSGSTITKCVAFFLAAAKDAQIKVSSHIRPPATKRTPKSRKADKFASSKKGDGDTDLRNRDQTPPPPTNPQSGWYEKLLAKFPEFDPSWDDETKKSWFIAFNDLMKKGAQP